MTTLSDSEKKEYLDQLCAFLKIPSISALPEHKEDMARAVTWLEDFLTSIGFSHLETLYSPTLDKEKHHPVLYASRIDNPENPTILIYGHYDVQPADPLAQWHSPPFEPNVRDGNIYARGATDDKGQVFTHLAALHKASESWGDTWPVNVKLLIEGEEEMGGENIEALVSDPEYHERFAADYCFVSDTGFIAPNTPTIEYGLRGIAYMQINVHLAEQDLHSGLYGGTVLNPANALGYMLSRLEDPRTGMITIPGIYDDVIVPTNEERERLGSIPYHEPTFVKEAGNARALRPEEGYSVIESAAIRPSLDINGLWAGFTGDGAKTIIPATAHAKVSIRTVPNQDPKKVAKQFADYIHEIAPQEVAVEVETIHVGDGALIDITSDTVQHAVAALKETFNEDVVFSRSGGSIPVVALLQKHLKLDPVLIGYGLPDDGLHSPNEKFSLNQFYKGIECNLRLYQKIAE